MTMNERAPHGTVQCGDGLGSYHGGSCRGDSAKTWRRESGFLRVSAGFNGYHLDETHPLAI